MGSVSLAVALPGHRNETMSLDSYTQNIPLTQKARFWSNYVSALKGSQDLRAPEEAVPRTWHPSIIETLPNDFPDLKHEFGKLESQSSTVLADVERTLSLLFCQMHETESSALDIRTVQSILRSMEHTELEPSELEQEYPVYISLICDETLAPSQGSIRVSINV